MGIDYKGNQGSKGKKTDPKRKDALELIESPSVSNSRKRRKRMDTKKTSVNAVDYPNG